MCQGCYFGPAIFLFPSLFSLFLTIFLFFVSDQLCGWYIGLKNPYIVLKYLNTPIYSVYAQDYPHITKTRCHVIFACG
ncbi:conserved hypothetical protein [Xenorhabdus szentirmaii DSM 16338]|uniref:Uncharacterized protein n=1 Tax=Xenorhabdus szentirmaii DSM 16338 TaxID=1427518 RepID=W1IWK7_9GAMM|nr:conserved hypothetical protein [Xenorhabdus szentirmaii DSM 16338]